MLTLYRRHTRSCGQKDRYYRRCKCPVWVEGTTNAGEYIRRSLKLTSWEPGEEKKRELEAGPASETSPVVQPVTPQPRRRGAGGAVLFGEVDGLRFEFLPYPFENLASFAELPNDRDIAI